ncbi:hypothetical protein WJX77_006310 [Trebouxia sp. C0004]
MSAATAGLVPAATLGFTQTSPCFVFPLTDRATNLEESSLLKVIEPEYAAKYLEYLGANPTQAAQDLVRQALPLTADCLQTKLKASGHRHNEVLVVPPPLQYDVLPIHEADAQEVVRLGFVGTLSPQETTSPEDSQAVDREYKIVSRSFTDVAAAFLDSASHAAPSHSSLQRHSGQYPLTDRQDPPYSVEPRAGRVGIYCHLDQMQRELSRPFKVQAASLKRIQLHFGQSVSEWYNALPRAAKSGHGQLKELDIQSTSDQLVSEDIIALAVNVVTFLYHEFVVSSPAFPADCLGAILLPKADLLGRQRSLIAQKSLLIRGGSMLITQDSSLSRRPSMLISQKSPLVSQKSVMDSQNWSRQSSLQPVQSSSQGTSAADLAAAAAMQIEGQRTRLFIIVQLWAKRSRAYNQSKWAASFARPVVILSLRALVEKAFTDAFPTWASSGQGAARLKSMDRQLLEWFDPHGFNSSISLLQSLPPATQQSQGSKRLQRQSPRKKQEFTGTTSLVNTFLTTPKTAECRRLKRQMQSRADGTGIAAVLNQQQKGALFKAAEHLLLQVSR